MNTEARHGEEFRAPVESFTLDDGSPEPPDCTASGRGAAAVPSARSYEHLPMAAFFMGVAGAGFSVGVGLASRSFPPASPRSANGRPGDEVGP